MDVIKPSGELAPFEADKIRQARLRVKTDPALIKQIIETVNSKIYDRIPTAELYRIIFDELKRAQKSAAAKYNLKHAIMQLGPTGYPFEKNHCRTLAKRRIHDRDRADRKGILRQSRNRCNCRKGKSALFGGVQIPQL